MASRRRELLRKVATLTRSEELAEVQALLASHKIPSGFQLRESKGQDVFWLFVEIAYAPQAREILWKRHLELHPEDSPAAIFSRGRKVLIESILKARGDK